MAIIVGDDIYNNRIGSANLDANYGPWDNVTQAWSELQNRGKSTTPGVTVGIKLTAGGVKEYWVQPIGTGFGLVEKGLSSESASKVRGVFGTLAQAQSYMTELKGMYQAGDTSLAGAKIICITSTEADHIAVYTLDTTTANNPSWVLADVPLTLRSAIRTIQVRTNEGTNRGDQVAEIVIDGGTPISIYAPASADHTLSTVLSLAGSVDDNQVPTALCVKTALATKANSADVGTLSNLNTTEKTTIVGAINEVAGDNPTIDTTTMADSDTHVPSSKLTASEIAKISAKVGEFEVGEEEGEFPSLFNQINGNKQTTNFEINTIAQYSLSVKKPFVCSAGTKIHVSFVDDSGCLDGYLTIKFYTGLTTNIYSGETKEVTIEQDMVEAQFTKTATKVLTNGTISVSFTVGEDGGLVGDMADVNSEIQSIKDFSGDISIRNDKPIVGHTYTIPVSYKDKYALHVKFNLPNDMSKAGDEVTFLRVPGYSNGTADGGFYAKLVKQNASPFGGTQQYKAGGNISFCCDNVKYSNHKANVDNNCLPFCGDDLFSVRYLGSDNDVVFSMADGGITFAHSSGSTIASVAFGDSYESFVSAMLNATAEGGSLNGIIEFTPILRGSYTIDDIIKVSNVPMRSYYETKDSSNNALGYQSYPCYVQLIDTKTHSIDVLFDRSKSTLSEYLRIYVDGYKIEPNKEMVMGTVSQVIGEMVVGAPGVAIESVEFSTTRIEHGFPKVATFVFHGVREGSEIGGVSDADNSVTLPYLRAFVAELKKHGYVPISIEDLRDYYTLGKNLPNKCFVITHDDYYYLGRDEAIYAELRKFYFGNNIKAAYAIIPSACTQDSVIANIKADMLLSSYVMHDNFNFEGVSYSDFVTKASAMINGLRSKGVMSNILIYPQGQYNENTIHMMKEQGIAFAMRGVPATSEKLINLMAHNPIKAIRRRYRTIAELGQDLTAIDNY